MELGFVALVDRSKKFTSELGFGVWEGASLMLFYFFAFYFDSMAYLPAAPQNTE